MTAVDIEPDDVLEAQATAEGLASDRPQRSGAVAAATDRTPPHDLSAERALLGAQLLSTDAVAATLDLAGPGDFYDVGHQAVAAAIAAVAGRGEPVDPITVLDELGDDADRRALVVDLHGGAGGWSNADVYARIVAGHARHRRVIQAARELHEAVRTAGDPGRALAEHRARLDQLELGGAGGRLDRLILPASRLGELPKPEPLIAGILQRRSLAVLYGRPGSAKSFLALDWAASVATGTWWHDHALTGAPVLYIAAEGAEGLEQRLDAWREANRIHGFDDRMAVLPHTVNLFDPIQAAELAGTLRRRPCDLVVIDTLSRSMAGAEENSARDMSIIVDHLGQLRGATDATLLLVHHTRKDGESARGSSALEGAADTMISVKAAEGSIQVECKKQKNSAEFPTIDLRLEPCGPSAVLAVGRARHQPGDQLAPRAVRLLELIDGMDIGHGVATGTWADAADDKHAIARTSYFETRKHLVDMGFVEQIGAGSRAPWRLTDTGRKVIEPDEVAQ